MEITIHWNTTRALAVANLAPPKIQEWHSCIFGGAEYETANAVVVLKVFSCNMFTVCDS